MLNYLILFLLPLYLVRISLSSTTSVNLLEMLLLLGIVSNFYTIFKTTYSSEVKNFFLKNKQPLFPFILIIIGFTTSYVLNQLTLHWLNWSDGLGKLLDIILLPILYNFSLLLLIKYKKISFSILLHTYFVSVLFVAILGLFYFFNNWLTFDHRLSMFFQSPNQLAIFIAPAILIGLYQLSSSRKIISPKNLFFTLPSLIVLLFNLQQTHSLGAQLALVLPALFLLFHFYYYHIIDNMIMPLSIVSNYISKFILSLSFAGVILSLLFIINIDIILGIADYHPKIPASSYDSRLTIYQVDQKIISKNWLIGIGPGSFQNVYLNYQKYFSPYPQWAVPHGHNNLVHFWIEGGLMAALGFLLLVYKILLPKKQLLNQKQILPISLFIYFIIHGLVDTTIWTSASALLFFLITIYLLTFQNYSAQD